VISVTIELCACGYHVYKDVREAAVGEDYCVNASPAGMQRTDML